ncbi:MAG TPA: amidohydrolase [Bacteroidota bacterium]|nr:amidohydrolase [Bacteroidota bacterium]
MTRKIIYTIILSGFLVALFLFFGALNQQDTATLVLRNGKIITVDDRQPQAQAIAVRGDKILAVGSNAEIERYLGRATQVIDLQGKLAIPGFIEGHGHFTGIGAAKMNLDLMKVKSWDEIVAMVGEAAKKAKPGEWILGRGWHQEKWDKVPQPNVEGFPTHESLDKVSPNNPVLLTHASGHAGFANGKALELAGITSKTPDPPGGEILKDAKGNPTGLLRETAQGLVRRALAEAQSKLTPEERLAVARKEIELAAQECLSKGVTSFQDAGSSFATVDLLKTMVDEGKLGVRLWVMVRESVDRLEANLAKYRMVNYGDSRLTVRAIKRSIDGALGPRGAWLLEPYSDLPSSTGLNTTPVDEIKTVAQLALQHGYQLCVHAIGDRANRETLNIFEEAFKKSPDKKDLRWRVEHAQHLHPADIPRFGKLGVIASMQGIHCTSDAPYVTARLGAKRAEEGAYVWQKLMKTGALIVNGTDAPVEDVSPIECFYASVSRKLKDGSVFYPDQRMTREEALKSYTINAAYGAFEENIKGSLTPGKLADIVVLSKDIMTIPEDEIPSTEVLYTIVGGKVAYKK